MPYSPHHLPTPPTRDAIDQQPGPTVLEFGTPWCGHCQRAQPLIETALAPHPHIPHLKIEDGPGHPLGRSYRIKLWPTLIFLSNGQEVSRLVRPPDANSITQALEHILPAK